MTREILETLDQSGLSVTLDFPEIAVLPGLRELPVDQVHVDWQASLELQVLVFLDQLGSLVLLETLDLLEILVR